MASKKQCWRYKCDHCGKVMYSPQWMARHEQGCTANKQRLCRMPIHELKLEERLSVESAARFLSVAGSDHGMNNLREACENCPACILAAIRCSGLQESHEDEDGRCDGVDFQFNFKEELAAMWNQVNEDKQSAECHY